MNEKINIFSYYGIMFASFFMMTTSFSNNGFSLLVIPILCFYLFYNFLIVNSKIEIKTLCFSMGIILILVLNLLFTFNRWNGDESQIKRFSLCLIGVFCYFSLSHIFKKIKINKIDKGLNLFLAINVLFFFIQIFFYYIFNINIDISTFLGGEGNRAMTYDGVYRGTGIYDEPAIYALFVSILVSMKLFLKKEMSALIIISIISMFLSLSFVAAIIAASIVLIFYISNKKLSVNLCFFIFISITIFCIYNFDLYPELIAMRIDKLINGADGSTLNKIEAFDYWWSNDSVRYWGFGFIGLREWTPYFFDAIYDLTFMITILTQFGIFLFPLIMFWVCCFLYVNYSNAFNLLIIFVVFVKLSAMYYLVFWVFLAFYQKAQMEHINTPR